MTYRLAIPLDGNVWSCDDCGAEVVAAIQYYYDDDGNQLDFADVSPSSRYWHGVRKVAYCSPECSLKGHQPYK